MEEKRICGSHVKKKKKKQTKHNSEEHKETVRTRFRKEKFFSNFFLLFASLSDSRKFDRRNSSG